MSKEPEQKKAEVRKHVDLEIKDPVIIFRSVITELENDLQRVNLRFPKEIIWLGGAPGAGKGTNTPFIQKERSFTADPIVVSDLLNSDEAKRIKDMGGMVGDREVTYLLVKELLKPIYQTGVIVDGFPRTKVQVECLKLLYHKMIELRNEFINTPLGVHFKYPLFRITVLFIEEKVSIERQLTRGKEIRAENDRRKEDGLQLLEERVTDFDPDLARNRYRVFKEQTYDALQSLRKHFFYHFINANANVQEVQWNIAKEFQYQSSLELNHDTFRLLRHIPLSSEIKVHARQDLVTRIEEYNDHHNELFQKMINFAEKKIIPIIHRHAISGHAIINSDDEILDTHMALPMLVDIFSDRGYHVVVDVRKRYIPDEIDPETNKIKCRTLNHFYIEVKFPGNEIRRGV